MRNKLLGIVLLALTAQAQADTAWSNLWRNPDPRGKSYAEFKAGNYAAAAQDLTPFDDSESNYNRGNALAFAGDLQGALKAYDAALKRDPANRDAQRNRDLVANALKQQQQQQPPKQDPKSDQKQDDKNGQKNDQQSKNGQSGNQQDNQQNNQQNNAQSGKPDQQNDGKSDAKPAPSNTSNANDGNTARAQAQQSGPAGKQDDADQARRDVTHGDADASGNNRPAPRPPPSEQQIAQDQWLRSIPDDPSGLLRRKFLIEHMIRQQSAQP